MENCVMNKIEEMENEGYERLPNSEDVTTCIKENETLNDIIIRKVIENSSNKNKIRVGLSQEQIYVVHPTVPVNVNEVRQSNQSLTDLKKSITNKTLTKLPSLLVNDIQRPLAVGLQGNRFNGNHQKKEENSELHYEFSMTENEKSNLLRKFSAPVIQFTNQGHNTVASNEAPDSFEFNEFTNNPRVLEEQYKCNICKNAFQDPRVLDCLHSFCLDCLTDCDLVKSTKAKTNDLCEFDLSCTGKTSESTFPNSLSVTSSFDTEQQKIINLSRSSVNRSVPATREKKNSIKPTKGRLSCISYTENQKSIQCLICDHETDIPNGGLSNLPPNFILAKKVNEAMLKVGMVSCSLCYNDVMAIGCCMTCNANLCSFCIQAHSRHRSTLMHEVRYLSELKNDRATDEINKKSLNCVLHQDYELKLFCTICFQVACSNCTLLVHRGHKCEPIRKAGRNYLKLIKDLLSKIRPIKDCANDSISKLNSISRTISERAEVVQNDVEMFLAEYLQALNVHQKTLLTQISRAKETKMSSIKDQQIDLSKRASETETVIKFTDELLANGSEIEILSFVGILLRRFDYCQKSKIPLDSKTSVTLTFLPEVRAPITKAQNNIIIPLYGIISTQIAVPKFCSLESDGLMFLRIHRKAEIVMISRDCYDKQLCHGGLAINVDLKYKDSSKHIPTDVCDKRDGTYIISFIPESVGNICLSVAINDKPIKASPYKLCVRTLRAHGGVFHCCSFCSTKGSKMAKCACGSKMPGGYKGCGHGHSGHPGRRHWSCCGSDLESSECSATNTFRT